MNIIEKVDDTLAQWFFEHYYNPAVKVLYRENSKYVLYGTETEIYEKFLWRMYIKKENLHEYWFEVTDNTVFIPEEYWNQILEGIKNCCSSYEDHRNTNEYEVRIKKTKKNRIGKPHKSWNIY